MLNQSLLNFQGLHPVSLHVLEVLAILEGVQKHLQRMFSAEEIKSGILEGLLIKSDYDVIRVVSFHV